MSKSSRILGSKINLVFSTALNLYHYIFEYFNNNIARLAVKIRASVTVVSRVLQVSVLGPLLFIFYLS